MAAVAPRLRGEPSIFSRPLPSALGVRERALAPLCRSLLVLRPSAAPCGGAEGSPASGPMRETRICMLEPVRLRCDSGVERNCTASVELFAPTILTASTSADSASASASSPRPPRVAKCTRQVRIVSGSSSDKTNFQAPSASLM